MDTTVLFISVTCDAPNDILWSGFRLTGTNCDRWTEDAPYRKGTEHLRTQDLSDSILFKDTFLKKKNAIAHSCLWCHATNELYINFSSTVMSKLICAFSLAWPSKKFFFGSIILIFFYCKESLGEFVSFWHLANVSMPLSKRSEKFSYYFSLFASKNILILLKMILKHCHPSWS